MYLLCSMSSVSMWKLSDGGETAVSNCALNKHLVMKHGSLESDEVNLSVHLKFRPSRFLTRPQQTSDGVLDVFRRHVAAVTPEQTLLVWGWYVSAHFPLKWKESDRSQEELHSQQRSRETSAPSPPPAPCDVITLFLLMNEAASSCFLTTFPL